MSGPVRRLWLRHAPNQQHSVEFRTVPVSALPATTMPERRTHEDPLMHACITAATCPHHRLEPAVTACLPQVPSPDADGPSPAPSGMRDRVSWRSAGTGIASLVTPVGIGVLHPVLGEVLVLIEVAVALTIIATALFGSQTLSERAFRFLRWIGNRPEPSGSARRQVASPRRRP
jgi:hypothetical protein